MKQVSQQNLVSKSHCLMKEASWAEGPGAAYLHFTDAGAELGETLSSLPLGTQQVICFISGMKIEAAGFRAHILCVFAGFPVCIHTHMYVLNPLLPTEMLRVFSEEYIVPTPSSVCPLPFKSR